MKLETKLTVLPLEETLAFTQQSYFCQVTKIVNSKIIKHIPLYKKKKRLLVDKSLCLPGLSKTLLLGNENR